MKRETWHFDNGARTLRVTGSIESLIWWTKALEAEHTPRIVLVDVTY